MVRSLAALTCVAWLAVAGALPTLHVHVTGDHEHPEHHQGPAVHTHARPVAAQPDAHGPLPTRIGPCDPDEHMLALSAIAVASKSAAAFVVAPAVSVGEPTIDGDVRGAPPRDVRAHSPPRLTDGPLRAPPASRPA